MFNNLLQTIKDNILNAHKTTTRSTPRYNKFTLNLSSGVSIASPNFRTALYVNEKKISTSKG